MLRQLQQQRQAAGPQEEAPAPKRAKKGALAAPAPAPDAGALQALSAQLAELQGRYSSVQVRGCGRLRASSLPCMLPRAREPPRQRCVLAPPVQGWEFSWGAMFLVVISVCSLAGDV